MSVSFASCGSPPTNNFLSSSWIEKRERAQIKSDEPSYIDMMFESGLDRETAVSDVLLAFQAGAHTTAMSITMQLYGLAKHPDIQERIFQELRRSNGDKDELVLTQKEDFKKLYDNAHLLRAFMEETARLTFIGTGNPRQLQDDFKMPHHSQQCHDNQQCLCARLCTCLTPVSPAS